MNSVRPSTTIRGRADWKVLVPYLDQLVDPDQTPLNWLQEHLTNAVELSAHVGYLDGGGVRLIQGPLREMLDRGGQVHLVVNRDGMPRRGDTTWLLELLSPYGERVSLRLVSDVVNLHTKVYLIRDAEGARHALVGSANFTAAGLTRNYEACIAIEPADKATLDAIEAAATAWRTNPAAVAVDLGVVNSMAELGAPDPTGSSDPIAFLMQPFLDQLEGSATGGAMVGVPTGFTELDRLLNGLMPGQLILIAGRPSMGKSTLALDILRNASIRSNTSSLLLSFEMSRSDVMNRLLSAEARVPLHVLRSGQLSDDDWTKLARRMGEVSEAPLLVNDACSSSLRHVVAEARRAVREDGVQVIAVDYVQQLQVDRRVENRQQEMSEISRALKRLAIELAVPVIAVSQLNRASEARNDKRPVMSDLRDSGSLEQDADVVILLHRDDYYDKESVRAGEADLIVAKHRNGPTDIVTVAAQLHLARFVDMAIV